MAERLKPFLKEYGKQIEYVSCKSILEKFFESYNFSQQDLRFFVLHVINENNIRNQCSREEVLKIDNEIIDSFKQKPFVTFSNCKNKIEINFLFAV